MTTPLLAQFGTAGQVGQVVIILIVCAAVIGIGLVAMRQAGIVPPPFVVSIAWIVLVAIVAIMAIKFLFNFV